MILVSGIFAAAAAEDSAAPVAGSLHDCNTGPASSDPLIRDDHFTNVLLSLTATFLSLSLLILYIVQISRSFIYGKRYLINPKHIYSNCYLVIPKLYL
jgi:hypothetical protein